MQYICDNKHIMAGVMLHDDCHRLSNSVEYQPLICV